MKFGTTALAVLLLAAPPALAHVHVHPEEAAAGRPVEIALQIGHGCAGQATTALRVALPEGLGRVLIVPQPGWSVTTAGEGRVQEIRWSGGHLPDHEKASFTFVATPEAGGELVLPVVQVCGGTEIRWIEGPGSDRPAPVLRVAPAA